MTPVVDVAFYQRPCRGEVVCGDAAGAVETPTGVWLVVADGLGHGPSAHVAATAAVAVAQTVAGVPATELLAAYNAVHERLRDTIGAAVGLAFLDTNTGKLTFAGVGNTVLRRFGTADTRLVSRDGVVGQRTVTPRPVELTLSSGDLVLLTTDGVTERFGTEDYPGLYGDSAAVVARTVVDRFGKSHDDATCLALRYRT
jgi:serine phosphatase RsbU (regulator of sigma subunit)